MRTKAIGNWLGALALGLAMGASGTALANGALAIDSNQGSRYGYSYDYPTMREAERRALRECGPGCRVVLRFPTGCGAYAADQEPGSTAYGWGTASSSGAAQSRALSECRARGRNCIIRVWGCNSD